jgi:hypothetical protein
MTIPKEERNRILRRFLYNVHVQDRPHMMESGPGYDNIEILWRKYNEAFRGIALLAESIFDSDDDITNLGDNIVNIGDTINNITGSDEIFSGFTPDGGHNLTTAFSDIPIDTEFRKDTPFSHSASSPEVGITETFDYEIIVEAGFKLNEGDIIELKLQRDTGSGYADIDCAKAYCGL